MYVHPSRREPADSLDWPYCTVARNMVQMAASNRDISKWTFQWRRKLETFGDDDESIVTSGPGGEIEGIW